METLPPREGPQEGNTGGIPGGIYIRSVFLRVCDGKVKVWMGVCKCRILTQLIYYALEILSHQIYFLLHMCFSSSAQTYILYGFVSSVYMSIYQSMPSSSVYSLYIYQPVPLLSSGRDTISLRPAPLPIYILHSIQDTPALFRSCIATLLRSSPLEAPASTCCGSTWSFSATPRSLTNHADTKHTPIKGAYKT